MISLHLAVTSFLLLVDTLGFSLCNAVPVPSDIGSTGDISLWEPDFFKKLKALREKEELEELEEHKRKILEETKKLENLKPGLHGVLNNEDGFIFVESLRRYLKADVNETRDDYADGFVFADNLNKYVKIYSNKTSDSVQLTSVQTISPKDTQAVLEKQGGDVILNKHLAVPNVMTNNVATVGTNIESNSLQTVSPNSDQGEIVNKEISNKQCSHEYCINVLMFASSIYYYYAANRF